MNKSITGKVCKECGHLSTNIEANSIHYSREHTYRSRIVIGDYELFEFINEKNFLLFMEKFPGSDEYIAEWSGPGWYHVGLSVKEQNEKIILVAKAQERLKLQNKLIEERDKLTILIDRLNAL